MHPFRRAIIPALAALFAFVINVQAGNPVSVSAQIFRPQVNFGEMAELQVKVTGAQQADVPQEIAVEGLQIRLSGQSTQVQMVNFKVSSSVVYTYVVLPLKTGNFTIPTVPVTADGQQFRTQPLAFSVVDALATGTMAPGGSGVPSMQPPRPIPPPMPGFAQRQARPATQPRNDARLAFGEIRISKSSIYAGEMVPVEIRFYFDARYPAQVRGKVDFGGEGIIAERFPDPKESLEERDGITYNVLTFRTLLSAVKPGPIDIAPAKLDSQIQMPAAVPPGFDDPVFQQLMGGRSPFGQTRDLAVKTTPLHLEVLPLPKDGRPASFAGAVGQFDLDAVVQNPKPAPGDPVTLTVKIGGKGNFNGMGAPVLTVTEGWRSYPPTDKFDSSGSSDGFAYTGVKSFDFTLIAQEARQSSPGSEFSYFDPTTAKYVTLSTKPLPVDALPGAPTNTASSSATSATSTDSKAPANAAATASGKDVTAVKEGDPIPGITLRPWSTPIHRSEFLIAAAAMIVATLTLAGILYLRDLQARGGTAASRRRRRIAQLWSALNADDLDAASSYDAAVEYAGLVAPPSEKRDMVIASLSERRDALKYGSGGSVPLPQPEREQLLQTLRKLAK
jgi:hypothetical protein